MAKRELQSILDGKELEIDINEELEEVATQELKSIKDSAEVEKRRLELKDLNLSVRSYNALNNSFRVLVKNVGDIIDLEEGDFWKIRNLGEKSGKEIIAKIHSIGLKMKWEEDRNDEGVAKALVIDEKSKTGILTIELGLSSRSYYCLARAGIDNVDDLIDLEEKNFRKIRNLGPKSADEIIDKIHEFGLKMRWEEDKATTDAQLGDSIQQLKTAYLDLKAKDKEYEELKQQLQANTESKKSAEINPNIEKQESEGKEQKNDDPSYGEL